mmetsp:Transcript_174413/g.559103  ORF Transcript_174413/g.559103 Transcript_174413/m.559103 type:complete len:90 (+) Transcript_174413:660-929(+)
MVAMRQWSIQDVSTEHIPQVGEELAAPVGGRSRKVLIAASSITTARIMRLFALDGSHFELRAGKNFWMRLATTWPWLQSEGVWWMQSTA